MDEEEQVNPYSTYCNGKEPKTEANAMDQIQKWQNKPEHSHYFARTKQADVDKPCIHHWLRSAGFKTKTEGLFLLHRINSC